MAAIFIRPESLFPDEMSRTISIYQNVITTLHRRSHLRIGDIRRELDLPGEPPVSMEQANAAIHHLRRYRIVREDARRYSLTPTWNMLCDLEYYGKRL